MYEKPVKKIKSLYKKTPRNRCFLMFENKGFTNKKGYKKPKN